MESFNGAADYLAGIRDAALVDVEVLKVPTRTSRWEMLLEGIALSDGPYVVHLANDTVVSTGWLDQLISIAKTSPALGLVGPMSNHAPIPQRVGIVPYKIKTEAHSGRSSFDVIDSFAEAWREQRRGKWSEVDNLSDFCLLIKRVVLDRLHLTSWPKEAGLLENMQHATCIGDLSKMARGVGFTSGCCHDLFVHHFGSRPDLQH